MTINNNAASQIKPVLVIVMIMLMVVAVFAFVLKNPRLLYSALLGGTFSALAFYQLIATQIMILSKGKKGIVFVRFLSRLVIYAVPVIIGVKFPQYFNLIVILICLFLCQIAYIGMTVRQTFLAVKKKDK